MRRSNWTPSIVTNDREANVIVDNSGRGRSYRGPAGAEAAQFPIPVAHLQILEQRSLDVVIQRRYDFALSAGLGFALALPAILGTALYLVMRALLRAG
jgi:hypothetical protein